MNSTNNDVVNIFPVNNELKLGKPFARHFHIIHDITMDFDNNKDNDSKIKEVIIKKEDKKEDTPIKENKKKKRKKKKKKTKQKQTSVNNIDSNFNDNNNDNENEMNDDEDELLRKQIEMLQQKRLKLKKRKKGKKH